MNAFESAGRSAKVLKLCMALDGAFDLWGIDPFSPAALEAVLAMSPKAWSEAAKHARVPLASITTQRQVEDLYRQRAEIRGSLQRLPPAGGGSMSPEVRELSLDYRTRVNHLINAISELSRAVEYLSRKLEDTADEGIAEDVQRRVEAVREYLNQAGWEL